MIPKFEPNNETGQYSGLSRYSNDVLSDSANTRRRAARPEPVAVGMVLEDPSTGYVGEVMRVYKLSGQWQMELEDGDFKRRSFPLGPGFWLEGVHVNLLPPTPTTSRIDAVPTDSPAVTTRSGAASVRTSSYPAQTSIHSAQNTRLRTASGAIYEPVKAKVAVASRIWVEGKHDAELVAKIWGSDLGHEGIMVEELFGADHLLEILEVFEPSETKRAGILLDHLVPGSKESRIAAEAERFPGVLVLGHPYVDIWQAVKPAVLGLQSWPEVPRGEDIKSGTLRRLGWPHETAEDIGLGWQRILERVNTYTDLEPALLSQVEQLIDFVTAA
ncbi:MAG: DUF3097 family protein, partial [Arcanobacterium sp.]|nr:DUF3097 family protein [Arcanobacterium sp.]